MKKLSGLVKLSVLTEAEYDLVNTLVENWEKNKKCTPESDYRIINPSPSSNAQVTESSSKSDIETGTGNLKNYNIKNPSPSDGNNSRMREGDGEPTDEELIAYFDEYFRPKTTQEDTDELLKSLPRDYAHLTDTMVKQISGWVSYLEGEERAAFSDIIEDRFGTGTLERIRHRANRLIRKGS